MSEVRSVQIQKSALRLVRRWWPSVLLPGLAVAALVGHESSALRESLTTTDAPVTHLSSATAAGVASDRSSVTVNGKTVPLDANGSVNMTLPDGGHIQVSGGGGNTSISNGNSGDSTSKGVPGSTSNVNVSVNSNGSKGNSWSSTQVNGVSNNANGSSSSFTSTNVFSTDSRYNDISSE